MKRIPIPPSAIYGVIKKHGPLTIDEIGIASRSHTLKMVSVLRDAGQVYISGWRESIAGRYRMELSAGSDTDAPMPKISREEELRRQREYRLARKPKPPPPPPPTLPDHAPVYGMWGI